MGCSRSREHVVILHLKMNERLRLALSLIKKELELLRLQQKISKEVRKASNESLRCVDIYCVFARMRIR